MIEPVVRYYINKLDSRGKIENARDNDDGFGGVWA